MLAAGKVSSKQNSPQVAMVTSRAAPTSSGPGFKVVPVLPEATIGEKHCRDLHCTVRKPRLKEGTFLRVHSDSCFQQAASLGIFSNPHFPPAQGCFEHIGHAIDSYTWGISWFGFAILMWTVRGGEPMGWVGCGRGAGAPLT